MSDFRRGACLGLFVHQPDAEREWVYDGKSYGGKLDTALDLAKAKSGTVVRGRTIGKTTSPNNPSATKTIRFKGNHNMPTRTKLSDLNDAFGAAFSWAIIAQARTTKPDVASPDALDRTGNAVTVTIPIAGGTRVLDGTLSDDQNRITGSLSDELVLGDGDIKITLPGSDVTLTRIP